MAAAQWEAPGGQDPYLYSSLKLSRTALAQIFALGRKGRQPSQQYGQDLWEWGTVLGGDIRLALNPPGTSCQAHMCTLQPWATASPGPVCQ